MNSHELARKMAETADYLLRRPEFETPSYSDDSKMYLGSYYSNKEKMLAAVRALGAGEKKYSGTDLNFYSATPIPIWFSVNRDQVCKKVQEEKWECEALLTPEEEASITQVSEVVDDIPF